MGPSEDSGTPARGAGSLASRTLGYCRGRRWKPLCNNGKAGSGQLALAVVGIKGRGSRTEKGKEGWVLVMSVRVAGLRHRGIEQATTVGQGLSTGGR